MSKHQQSCKVIGSNNIEWKELEEIFKETKIKRSECIHQNQTEGHF